MQIKIFLDDATEPLRVLKPPEKFTLDTEHLVDGEHKLTFKAVDESQITSVRIMPFTVQNGPSIVVHGIVENDTLSGTVSVLANAYSARQGDEFEPSTMETPAPVPTWAWVLTLVIMAWGAGYITLETHAKSIRDKESLASLPTSATVANEDGASQTSYAWAELGSQVYGNNCASCHQGNGSGLPGVFPSLVGNASVLNDDPTEHIQTVINGLSDKIIDGVSYTAPMPQFGTILSDQDIAAVVNHERTQWGNSAKTVTPNDVSALR